VRVGDVVVFALYLLMNAVALIATTNEDPGNDSVALTFRDNIGYLAAANLCLTSLPASRNCTHSEQLFVLTSSRSALYHTRLSRRLVLLLNKCSYDVIYFCSSLHVL
jgi:hypothetical protein